MAERKIIPGWLIHNGVVYDIRPIRTARLEGDWYGDESNGLAVGCLANTERQGEQSPNGKLAIIDVGQMSDLEFAAYLSAE